jgi:hypothetical protein
MLIGYSGGLSSGDFSQSLIWLAVSSCLIFFARASRAGAVWGLCQLIFAAGFLGCGVLFKCVGDGLATLHDTPLG